MTVRSAIAVATTPVRVSVKPEVLELRLGVGALHPAADLRAQADEGVFLIGEGERGVLVHSLGELMVGGLALVEHRLGLALLDEAVDLRVLVDPLRVGALAVEDVPEVERGIRAPAPAPSVDREVEAALVLFDGYRRVGEVLDLHLDPDARVVRGDDLGELGVEARRADEDEELGRRRDAGSLDERSRLAQIAGERLVARVVERRARVERRVSPEARVGEDRLLERL